jgi:surface antigen
MKTILWILACTLLLILGFWGLSHYKNNNPLHPSIGQEIDKLNGVAVYYNGGVGNVSGRNTTADGYNLGLKYQCVEFVKRYYYEYFNHKMPDSYGHAKDFFSNFLADGKMSHRRNLIQYTNPSLSKPQVSDLLVFDGTVFNKYGHVAIVSKVTNNQIEIIQQNPGPGGKSRETFSLKSKNGKWEIQNARLLGWLRKS